MNPLLRAKHDALKALQDESDALLAKSEHTADENKRIKELPDAMKAIQEEIEGVNALSTKSIEISKFMDGTGAVKSIQAVPELNEDQIKQMKIFGFSDEQIQAMGAKMVPGERVGTEVYGRTPAGDLLPKESEGWGLSEKQFKAISEKTYARAFDKFMRNKADVAEMKTLSEGLDTGGGYLAPPEYITEVIQRKPHPTVLLAHVRRLPCSRDRVIFPRVNYDSDSGDIFTSGVRIQWIGEGGPTPAITDPVFGDVEIPIFTGQFPLEVSRNLLEDAAVPVQTLLMELASQAYQLGMDNVVVNGTGVGQPTGFLTGAGNAGLFDPVVNCGNPITADGLTTLVYGLPPQYSDNESTIAVMNRMSAFATFAQIKDADGQYIFGLAREMGPEGMAVARKPVLFGYPVVFSAFMPNVGGGNQPVAFGDFRENYVLAERVGLTVMPYGDQDKSMLAANKVGWMFRFRAGGMVVQNRAVHVGQQS